MVLARATRIAGAIPDYPRNNGCAEYESCFVSLLDVYYNSRMTEFGYGKFCRRSSYP
jgi:hypothetical protein